MSLSYTYTPQIWPQAVKALMLIALAVYSGRRRSLPGELSFTFALLFGALWMVGVSLEVVCIDPRSPTAWQSINEVNPTVAYLRLERSIDQRRPYASARKAGRFVDWGRPGERRNPGPVGPSKASVKCAGSGVGHPTEIVKF